MELVAGHGALPPASGSASATGAHAPVEGARAPVRHVAVQHEPTHVGSAGDDASQAEADRIAQAVGAFYERHPYPAPVDDLERYREFWDGPRRRADACLFHPVDPQREDHSILVAGCGTSQAAKYALRWPRAQVTGIDVSQASIAATARLKNRHGLDNLELHQLSVERVAELGRTFEHIACTGVLHHLPDPDRGLRALRDVLAPGGALHLMVYAPHGRHGVYMLQDYCRRLGIGTTRDDIRELAAALGLLPAGHPLAPLLRSVRDFQDEAGLADALLHPNDRAYSVPELFELLATAGLAFARWLRQAAYLPRCGLLAASPHHARMAELPPEEQYAAAELFRGSMVEHSLVAHRDDYPRAARVTFDSEAWPTYVPVRLPGTIVVQERLPEGAAAVLINRAHTFTDLYLPIDAEQKALFDRIDGTRTIAAIAGSDASRSTARNLFQQLWDYDQVVFATDAQASSHDTYRRDRP